MRRLYFSWMAIALYCCATAFGGRQGRIDWKPWSDSVFVEARNEHRFVLLDLGTVWCHWCTADRAWLERAEHAAGFIAANFKAASGYLSNTNEGVLKSKPPPDGIYFLNPRSFRLASSATGIPE